MNRIKFVALKRQQAAEDKIALHLASVESGAPLTALPPGRIYGMRVTRPCPSPGAEPDSAYDDQAPIHIDSETSDSLPDCCSTSPDSVATSSVSPRPSVGACDNEGTGGARASEAPVSAAGLEMLAKLFPGKKRAVLELVLRRCNHDLLRAVDHFNATHVMSENSDGPLPFKYLTPSHQSLLHQIFHSYFGLRLFMGGGNHLLYDSYAVKNLKDPHRITVQQDKPSTSFSNTTLSTEIDNERWSAFRPVGRGSGNGDRPLVPTALLMGRVCGSEWLVPLPALSAPLLLPLQPPHYPHHPSPPCGPDCRQCNSHH
ncbi:hypothetical protein EVAR_6511_1 [Eumeta japonica]|uniref:DMA domain-containing protein n=1 Tax=Eumeta variegata TaxID=151549 RepID=A0A4C1SPZ1_EUMVA|nr:hypothetical protein EVAR_6511_1 [Eumeta japonica]